ncbi:monocarboxylate permease [Aspergillus nomiae NRRL 13137]|uniref:Monocarboxylate permease n=1 Tax=Aspergillus nomiae NRRL (strain ATCC 15546 / NRRL 13137 / CBS 260.88 / M93) TaxID=1509407 RepID=A0A0L1IM90_ASPN3|nr:monocarboxylate permease [Aspergillus nomiae NRRL 13137]KNG80731.1 monocarboxylate permease [Aspergillus nomiae NRRL 13137]
MSSTPEVQHSAESIIAESIEPSPLATPVFSSSAHLNPEDAKPEHPHENIQPGPQTILEDESSKTGDPEKSGATTQSAPAKAPGAPPDGGFKAWMVVLGAFCGLFVSFGWINCEYIVGFVPLDVVWALSSIWIMLTAGFAGIGVFLDYYKTHQLQDLPTSTGPIVGVFFDNFGPRWILIAGTFFHVFGLMMVSISKEYYQFILAQGVCSPIGTSAIFHGCLTSVSTWFGRRRALALGVTTCGSSVGGVIFPIMVARLIPIVGFGWTMRICGFLGLGLLIIANITVQSRLQHQRKPFRPLDFVRPLRELPFLLTTAGTFFVYWGLFLPFAFIPTQAERYGMSAYLASYLIPILNAASILGRLVPPYLADLFGRFNLMILTSLFSVIIVLALWLPSRSNAPAIVFTSLYGFSSGAAVSLAPALVAQISDIREIGVRSGTYFCIVSFAALTGMPIAGALLPDPLHGSYLKLEIFCGVVMFGGVLFYLWARGRISGWGLMHKV